MTNMRACIYTDGERRILVYMVEAIETKSNLRVTADVC